MPLNLKLPLSHTENSRYLLAVSGGLDSMSLLSAFQESMPTQQFIVAHYNHKTRGTEADLDADFVRDYCKKFSIEFHQGVCQIQGLRSELDLRVHRRRYLLNLRSQLGMDFICTAHHSNDQLETLLMRIIRGTDIKGMAGIRYREGVWLRPLLHYSRSQLELYANKHELSFRHDSSNNDTTYFRNSIRKETVHALLQCGNKTGVSSDKILQHALEWGRRSEDIYEYLSLQANEVLQSNVTQTSYWARVSLSDWNKTHPALRPLVMNMLCEKYLGVTLCQKQYLLFEKGLEERIKEFHLEGGVCVRVSMGYWYLISKTDFKNKKPRSFTSVPMGKYNLGEIEVILEVEKGLGNIDIRYFQPGDRLIHSGKKLKDLFQRQRVPSPERKYIPVVAKAGSSDVLWYLGLKQGVLKVSVQQCEFPFLIPV